jgi:hypothetical protein
MRNDFCAFILTHGRAGNVATYKTLIEAGYTGKIFLVVDDADAQIPEYKKEFGDKVLIFSKAESAATFDEGDTFGDRRAIIYARNACFGLAAQVGCKYFIQLDDDYTRFSYRFAEDKTYLDKPIFSIDAVLESMVKFFEASGALSIAMAQGGDHLGGSKGSYARSIGTRRKAMNTFICSTDRPFQFFGRVNEDVNTYTNLGRRGGLFLTILGLSIVQKQTQSSKGGMTEMYVDSGTYVKSFYSIMYSPSCVKITMMGERHRRLHHRVNWNSTAPMIIREGHKKDARQARET